MYFYHNINKNVIYIYFTINDDIINLKTIIL